MKNFREEQINSTDEYCINQYWEKEIEVEGITITLHYWRRKEGCKGYFLGERINKVVGLKDEKKKQIRSVWVTGLGENHCIEYMVSKFKEPETK
jgi:hypothetical protein